MRNFTRVKPFLFLMLAGCSQVMAQEVTTVQNPCRKENLLKSEDLTNEQLVFFKGASGTNYSWINWSTTCTLAPTTDGLFVLKVTGDNGNKQVKLQRLSDNKFLKKNGTNIEFTETENEAVLLTPSNVELPAEEPDYLFPYGVSRTDNYTVRFTSEGNHLNIQNVHTNPKFAGGVGGYSAQLVYDAKKYIKEALAYNTTQLVGESVGQYPSSENVEAKINEAKEALTALEGEQVTNEQIKTAIEKNKALVDVLKGQDVTLNVPTAGFYRFKSLMNGKYISSTKKEGNNRMTLTDQKDNTTVFYLSEDGRITGSNLINLKSSGCDASGLGDTYQILEQERLLGTYKIDPSSGNPVFAKRDGYLDNSSDSNAPNCGWILEPVTSETPKFTKEMTKDYATLAAPVALTIPEGVEAYTVTAQGNKAVLNAVSETIPAGTAVLLKKTGEGTSFDFNFAASATAVEGTNNLTGVYVDTEIPTETTAYILGENEGQYGFYKVNASDRNLAANKAYLTLPAAQANLQSIIIGGGTTGIDEIVTGETAKEVYFDLQGRRIQNPTKGIYVTKSGKKVVFNK